MLWLKGHKITCSTFECAHLSIGIAWGLISFLKLWDIMQRASMNVFHPSQLVHPLEYLYRITGTICMRSFQQLNCICVVWSMYAIGQNATIRTWTDPSAFPNDRLGSMYKLEYLKLTNSSRNTNIIIGHSASSLPPQWLWYLRKVDSCDPLHSPQVSPKLNC
jgi:hypothetical protein